jgi:hypothetical protein
MTYTVWLDINTKEDLKYVWGKNGMHEVNVEIMASDEIYKSVLHIKAI